MHSSPSSARARLTVVLVVASCVSAPTAAIGVASARLVDRASDTAAPSIEATHVPPLLTLPGEDVELDYDAFCVGTEPSEADQELPCEIIGSVFVRSEASREFSELPLRRSSSGGAAHLSAAVPVTLTSSRGFSYYAVLHAPGASPLTIPGGGAAAPHASFPAASAIRVDLGRHTFGAVRRADERVATAAWGSGSSDVGQEQGRAMSPIGASAFDVDAAGTIHLLDEVHRRVLRWRRGARQPERIPVSVTGTLADMAVAPDGSIFVLETVARAGGNPLVRRFGSYGRDLDVIEASERGASQIRMGLGGPFVLEQPAHQWMPVFPSGSPATGNAQLQHGRVGRPLAGGGEVILLRRGNEIRVALLSGGGIRRAWRVTSVTDIGEVQLAEPFGQGLVVVARVYTDDADEFVVLLLAGGGLVRQFSLDPADWAETAPLGRFKLAGRSLYHLGSTPTSAFVDRFDLEVG